MSRVIAFLDSCVLYPFSLRDILLQYSVDGFFQAKWSVKVRQEVIRNVEAKNPQTKGKLKRTFDLMEEAVPDFLATPSLETINEISGTTTDQKDVDILAAAIDSGCSHMVTSNLKDFDISHSMGRGVFIIHPDEFLEAVISGNLIRARVGFDSVVSRYKNPKRTKDEFCDALIANQLSKTVSILRSL